MKVVWNYLLVAALASLGCLSRAMAQADLPAEAQAAVTAAKQEVEGIRSRAADEERQRHLKLGATLSELARQLRAQGRAADAEKIERYLGVASPAPMPPAPLPEPTPVGKKCEVEWNGQWYPAVVLKQEANRFYIQYEGYGDEWNEWVGPERIRGIELKGVPDYAAGSAVEILWGGTWWPGKLEKIENGRYYISYDGYGPEWNEWIGGDRIRSKGAAAAAGANRFPVGAKVDVLWHGTWYPSVVLKAEANRWFIKYDQDTDAWNEWVGPERIRDRKPAAGHNDYVVGSKVDILWGGNWWPGEIRKSEGGRYYIHYDNHDDTWDEWVGPDRLRPRQAAAVNRRIFRLNPDNLKVNPYEGRPAFEYASGSLGK